MPGYCIHICIKQTEKIKMQELIKEVDSAVAEVAISSLIQ